MTNDELMHYGILGQKWGIRRYQNEDGTLTAKGKKRAEQLRNELDSLEGNKSESKSSGQRQIRSINDLSNDELSSVINRMRLEDQYSDLMAKRNPKKEHKILKAIGNTMLDSSMAVLKTGMIKAGSHYVNSFIDSKLINKKK